MAWLACVSSGCSSEPAPAARRPGELTPTDISKQRAAQAEGLPARLVAEVPAGTFGPYLGAARDRKLLVWAQTKPDGSGDRYWYAKAVPAKGDRAKDDDGARDGGTEPLRLAPAPAEIGLATVKAVSGAAGATRGFVVVATTPREAGDELSVFALGPEGQMVMEPRALADGLGSVLWVDVTTTSSQALVWWAERDDTGASVSLHGLSERFEPLGGAQQVVTGAWAWQARGFETGAALAAVVPPAKTPAGVADPGGDVRLFFVDDSGKPSKDVTVSEQASAERSIDAAVSAQGIWLAWTDRRGLEPRVVSALVDRDAALSVAPIEVAPSTSPQALSRLVAAGSSTSSARPFVVWEEPAASSLLPGAAGGRGFYVARLGDEGQAGASRVVIEFGSHDAGGPELAATDRSLGALTLAAPCPGERPCDEPLVPTFVELDGQLRVRRNGPIRPAPMDSFADMAWGLSCLSSPCTALVASVTDPAPVYDVELTSEVREWRAPALSVSEPSPPALRTLTSLVDTDALADVALTATDDRSRLLVWLTEFDPNTPYERPSAPAPDGRWAPVRAKLEVAAVADDGTLSDRRVVSYRARSVSGVALAHHAAKKKALLIWSALDQQQPQVFVTLLTSRGARINQRMLTRSKGEILDVAATAVSDGFVLAWVDDRRGHPDVYVKKLNLGLAGPGTEQPLTGEVSQVTGLVLERIGDQLWLAWAEFGKGQGQARLVLRRLDPKNGALVGEEIELPAAPAARSLVLSARAGAPVLGWSEPQGAAGDSVIQLRSLDASGSVQHQATLDGGGSREGLDLECGAETCRGLSLLSLRGRDLLEPWIWHGTDQPKVGGRVPLLVEQAAHRLDLSGDRFALTDLAQGRGRVRWGQISWP